MTPASAIAMLDRQLAAHGETVTLRRPVANAAAIEVDVLAFVRGYRPDELAGGIQQGDSEVVLSPTSLVAPWPDLPKRLDKVLIDGRLRNVEMANAVRIAGEVVRINLMVRG